MLTESPILPSALIVTSLPEITEWLSLPVISPLASISMSPPAVILPTSVSPFVIRLTFPPALTLSSSASTASLLLSSPMFLPAWISTSLPITLLSPLLLPAVISPLTSILTFPLSGSVGSLTAITESIFVLPSTITATSLPIASSSPATISIGVSLVPTVPVAFISTLLLPASIRGFLLSPAFVISPFASILTSPFDLILPRFRSPLLSISTSPRGLPLSVCNVTFPPASIESELLLSPILAPSSPVNVTSPPAVIAVAEPAAFVLLSRSVLASSRSL